MPSQKFYWVGNVQLEKGSVVLPGNWIRIIQNTPGHPLALREQVYEQVRAEQFPGLPSRYTSNFICDGLENMKKFVKRTNRMIDVLYEVEIVEGVNNTTRLDSDLLGIQNMAEGGRLLSVIELSTQAHRYWSSHNKEDIEIPEILTPSPIRIRSRVLVESE